MTKQEKLSLYDEDKNLYGRYKMPPFQKYLRLFNVGGVNL